MDLFGRKAKAEVKRLQILVDMYKGDGDAFIKEAYKAGAERDALIKTLRDQDQLIFSMSQQTSWETQRPIFNQLQRSTEARMQIESGRIRDVLIPEIRKAYTETTSKQIEHKS